MFATKTLLSAVSKSHPTPGPNSMFKTAGLILGFTAPIGFYSFYYQSHYGTILKIHRKERKDGFDHRYD